MISREPLLFRPIYKQMLWGGNRLAAFKGDPDVPPQTGESWELSAIDGNVSIIDGGTYDGTSLSQLANLFGPELLGSRVHNSHSTRFPLLVKFIDAAADLSIQVHPDDNLAWQRHKLRGKTEMWYVIDSQPGANIYCGLTHPLTPDIYTRLVQEGTFHHAVQTYPASPGDVFFIPSGRVHAIGAGNLLVEIQQTSDITYRIFDYNRLGADGKPRQLHTREALEAIDFNDTENCRCHPDGSDQPLVQCPYFTTRLLHIDGHKTIDIDPDSFVILVCVEGKTHIELPDGQANLTTGHTALLPATAGRVNFRGAATILAITA